MVAAAEFLGDGGIREVGDVAEDVHADLAGNDKRPAPALPAEIVDGEAEHVGGGIEDGLGCDLAGLVA